MSTTSLSAISNLPIYALGEITLESLISGNDLKIEISKGNSPSEPASTYTSYKLDLNRLLSIIRTYVDDKYREAKAYADANFVQISGETRLISSDNLTFKTSNNLKLHSDNNIELSSNSNIDSNIGI
jgi:hypothetical protein